MINMIKYQTFHIKAFKLVSVQSGCLWRLLTAEMQKHSDITNLTKYSDSSDSVQLSIILRYFSDYVLLHH